jgi:phenylpropionate dioxygenase-like ring-hydroxylating dioxygenase large terminal subunit
MYLDWEAKNHDDMLPPRRDPERGYCHRGREREGSMFLRNIWYVAAFSLDVSQGQLLVRKFLGEPVVLFRKSDGSIAALEDRCSHRAMPLSAGLVDGDIIRCAYHGVEFDCTGKCTRVPNQPRIPPAANIKSYPTVEKDGIVWIWMGAPEAADPTQIVDNPEHVDPKWTWKHFYFHVQSDWQLLVDNILDLTHLPYIHARTIGGNPEQHYAAETKVEFDGRKVSLDRHMPNSIPPKSYIDAKGFKGRVDRWQEVRFSPHEGMVLRVNAGACDVDTGAYQGRRDHGFMLVNVHGITPETETSSHYSWSICTTAPKESGVPEILFQQFYETIKEDEEAVALQQMRISDGLGRPFVGIASDGAVNQGRRLLEAMASSEADQQIAAE